MMATPKKTLLSKVPRRPLVIPPGSLKGSHASGKPTRDTGDTLASRWNSRG